MKRLFDYCVCSIANIYKKIGLLEDYLAQGYFLMFFAFTCITLAVVKIVLFQFGQDLDTETIVVLSIPMILEVFFYKRIFPNCEQVFEKYERKDTDKLRWVKTAFVLLFLLLSFVFFVWSLCHFKISQ